LVISGVLALAPVCDLVAAHRLGLGEGAVANLLGDAAQQPDLIRAIDPMALPTPTMPTVIVHGDADQRVPISQARDYVARHPGVRLVDLPGVDHFAPVDPRSPAWPEVLAALATL
jgi:pimeloyl-ACP methyl ester carboxylesterase